MKKKKDKENVIFFPSIFYVGSALPLLASHQYNKNPSKSGKSGAGRVESRKSYAFTFFFVFFSIFFAVESARFWALLVLPRPQARRRAVRGQIK
jgi:hypothetical protein